MPFSRILINGEFMNIKMKSSLFVVIVLWALESRSFGMRVQPGPIGVRAGLGPARIGFGGYGYGPFGYAPGVYSGVYNGAYLYGDPYYYYY